MPKARRGRVRNNLREPRPPTLAAPPIASTSPSTISGAWMLAAIIRYSCRLRARPGDACWAETATVASGGPPRTTATLSAATSTALQPTAGRANGSPTDEIVPSPFGEMGRRGHIADRPGAGKERHDDDQICPVSVAQPWIIDDQRVSRRQRPGRIDREDGPRRRRQGASESRGLQLRPRDGPGASVQQHNGEITGLAKDRGEGRKHHRDVGLVHDRDQRAPADLHGDRIAVGIPLARRTGARFTCRKETASSATPPQRNGRRPSGQRPARSAEARIPCRCPSRGGTACGSGTPAGWT